MACTKQEIVTVSVGAIEGRHLKGLACLVTVDNGHAARMSVAFG